MLLLFYYLLLAIECLKSIFFCSNKSKTPVLFPQVLAVQVLMAILLIASTTSLAMPAVEWYKVHKDHLDRYGRSMSTDGVNVAMLFCALVRYFIFFPKFLFLSSWWAERTNQAECPVFWRMTNGCTSESKGWVSGTTGREGGRGEDFGSVTITFTWSTPKAQKYSNPPPPSLLYSLSDD